MFHVKNHKQLNIVDPWAHLGPKRRKFLDSSRAGLFQQHILPQLPVESLRRHYHNCHGRPTNELYAMMGLMVLQQMHDCTDQEAVEQFCFNIQWHYALNITAASDTVAYISHKTLWTMRDHLATDESYTEIFESSLQTLAGFFQADLSRQRMTPASSSIPTTMNGKKESGFIFHFSSFWKKSDGKIDGLSLTLAFGLIEDAGLLPETDFDPPCCFLCSRSLLFHDIEQSTNSEASSFCRNRQTLVPPGKVWILPNRIRYNFTILLITIKL